MKYQLILQFPADGLTDFDELVDLEEALDDALLGVAAVDGHDFGLREFNIFVITDDPVRAFGLVRPIITALRPATQFKAAYRELEQETLTILWSPGVQRFNVS